MRNTVIALTLATTLTAAGAASADQNDGRIVRVDDATRIVLMDNGDKYVAASDLNLEQIQWGELYEVTYEMKDGQMVAHWFTEPGNKEDAD